MANIQAKQVEYTLERIAQLQDNLAYLEVYAHFFCPDSTNFDRLPEDLKPRFLNLRAKVQEFQPNECDLLHCPERGATMIASIHTQLNAFELVQCLLYPLSSEAEWEEMLESDEEFFDGMITRLSIRQHGAEQQQ